MLIKNNYLIEKRNILNNLRSKDMTLQELRFFSIYLAKINSRNIDTRIVKFKLSDFQTIMQFGKLNITQINTATDNLLSKIVKIPKDNGGFKKFQLFKNCNLDTDENGDWFIEIDAHDDALPLMFEFKEKYFSYQLWNTLRLKSLNQLRMYEVLKQYEKIGERIIDIVELKELLGLKENEYTRYERFKTKVLESCRKALEENTDIRFTYETTGKKGKSGKILKLKFKIYKNKDYTDPLSLDDFISSQSETNDDEIIFYNFKDAELDFVGAACDYEFTEAETRVLLDLIKTKIPYNPKKDMKFDYYQYLECKVNELDMRASKTTIKNRFGYLKTIIEADLKD